MVLILVVGLATLVLVRSENCGYEYNPDTGYMDYWCSDGSYDNFESYVADVASYEATPRPPPPPPAFPTNHCRGGSPFLGDQFCQISGGGGVNTDLGVM